MEINACQPVWSKAWLIALAFALSIAPAALAMQQPGGCCADAQEQAVCSADSLEGHAASAAQDSCCDQSSTNGQAPSEDPDQQTPCDCDCTCCVLLRVPAPVPPVVNGQFFLPIDPVSLLVPMPKLCPDSAVLGVDIQPPIV